MKRAQLTAAKHAARHSRIAHLLRTTCPYCYAPAGEPCRSKSGIPIWEIGQMHDARLTLRAVIEVNIGRDCSRQAGAGVFD
jgi:hypothetical protein